MEHQKRRKVVLRAGRQLLPLWLPSFCRICLLLACVSCSSPLVEFADYGESGLPADRFRMELPAETRDQLRIIDSPDFNECREQYLGGGQIVMFEFRKNRPAAVLAYLPSAGRPYGAIYPYTERFEAKDGFAAEILWELYNGGVPCTEKEKENVRLFNWHKLMSALRELEDPWLVDSEKVKDAIRDGKFSKGKLKTWVKN